MTPLQCAIGELGTTEFPRNSNKVKYNDWYYGCSVSGDAYPWCMAFVQWCFNEAGAPLPYKTASCSALLRWYKSKEPTKVFSKPQKGDIAIFSFGHTGIVESCTNDTITCIEGNTSATSASNGGEVMRATRRISQVNGFIRPYDETPAEAKHTVTVEVEEVKLGSRGNAVKILQLWLNKNGYSCGSVDGDAGSKTITALRMYQKDNNLDADGIAGKATWSNIFSK